MKKKYYIKPEAEIIRLRIADPVMVTGDLDFGSGNEDSTGSWFGAKEQGFSTDETEDIWGMKTKDVWER